MADEPDDIVLVYLRRLDEKVDRIAADVGDIKTRLTWKNGWDSST